MKKEFHSIDEYIEDFSSELKERLIQMRYTIIEAAPNADEGISYGMPAFKVAGKPLVYFAGYKNHIGFYATPTGHEKFAQELAGYKQGRGSVQFPNNKPLPLDLIKRITLFRVQENLGKIKK